MHPCKTLVLKSTDNTSRKPTSSTTSSVLSTSDISYSVKNPIRNVVAARLRNVAFGSSRFITIHPTGRERNNIVTFSELNGSVRRSFLYEIPPGRYTASELVHFIRLKGAYGYQSNSPGNTYPTWNTYDHSDVATAPNSDVCRFFIVSNYDAAAKTTLHLSQVVFNVTGITNQQGGFTTYGTDLRHGMLPGALIDLRNLRAHLAGLTGDLASQFAVITDVTDTTFTVFGGTATASVAFPESVSVTQYSRLGNFFRDLQQHDSNGSEVHVNAISPYQASIQINHPPLGLKWTSAAYVATLDSYTGLSVTPPLAVSAASCTSTSTVCSTACAVTPGTSFKGAKLRVTTTTGFNNFFHLAPNPGVGLTDDTPPSSIVNESDSLFMEIRINNNPMKCVHMSGLDGIDITSAISLDDSLEVGFWTNDWFTFPNAISVNTVTVRLYDNNLVCQTNYTRDYTAVLELQTV